MALGLHGPSETVSAGGATGLAALLRGDDLLRTGRATTVLVVAGDELNSITEHAFKLGQSPVPPSEVIAAVLLSRDGDCPIAFDASPIPSTVPVFARATPFPDEDQMNAQLRSIAPETVLGMNPALGLAVALTCRHGGGWVVDQDHGQTLTVRVG